MNAKLWLAIGCMAAGLPLAALGLSQGSLLIALLGLALVLTFVAMIWQWIAGVNKPDVAIKPAANSAWSEFNRDAGAAADANRQDKG
jgi:hypothetical protein